MAADHGRFSINLSGASLVDVDFPDFVQDRLCLSGVAPQRICFEIAEVSAVAQGDGARKLFSALRTIGCAVTLDNFVSGPSAFLDLKQHPVDFLKIDGRLIHTIDRDALDFELVDSINRMAHVLNIKTIAGSVETRTTKDALDRINVDFVQGYAVHAPQSLESLLN